jgi:hypothetical protein
MAKRTTEKPIPVKFGPLKNGIKALAARTKASDSDIIRRLVAFSLSVIDATGRVDFLFDEDIEEDVRKYVARASAEATQESLTPIKGAHALPSKSRKAAAATLADLKEKHGG